MRRWLILLVWVVASKATALTPTPTPKPTITPQPCLNFRMVLNDPITFNQAWAQELVRRLRNYQFADKCLVVPTNTPVNTTTPVATPTPFFWFSQIETDTGGWSANVPNDFIDFEGHDGIWTEGVGIDHLVKIHLDLRTLTVTATPTRTATGTQTTIFTPTTTNTATATVTQTPTFLFDWSVFHPSSGSNIAATVFGDTANFTCVVPLVCTGDGNHTITWSINPTPTFTPTYTPTITPTATITNTPTNTATSTLTPTFLFDWAVFHPSSGSNISATVAGDTANFTCQVPLACTGDGSHTITFVLFTATPTATPTTTPTATITNTPASTSTSTATPTNAASNAESYVVVSLSAALTNERNAAVDSTLTLTDSGANAALTWGIALNNANTWTATQTFNATTNGINLPTNKFASFGTSNEAGIEYDGTNLIIAPERSGSGFLGVNGFVKIPADNETLSSGNPAFLTILPGTFTYGTNLGSLSGIKFAGTITFNADPFITSAVLSNMTFTNKSTDVRAFGVMYNFADLNTLTFDTQTGQSGTYDSFQSSPTFNRVNAGAGTINPFTNFTMGGTVGAGVTVTSRNGILVNDLTVNGTLTTQVGVSVANLTAAGTNWSMQIGSAQSYHVGKIMFGGTGSPADDINLDGQAAKVIRVIRDTTGATAGQNLLLQAGGAVSGGGNLAGGKASLAGGIVTGTGRSIVEIQTVVTGGAAGDHNPAAQHQFIDGHLESTNSQPAVSVCGTPGPTPVGTDESFDATTGTGTFTACTITFAKSFTNKAICNCSPDGNRTLQITAASQSAITITSSASFPSSHIYCNCLGRY